MNPVIEYLVQCLNNGDAHGLRQKLSQYKGEIAAFRLLQALVHNDCTVTVPGAISLLLPTIPELRHGSD